MHFEGNAKTEYFNTFRIRLLFSHLVVFYFLQPHGLQHARFPCPSPSPRACSNSCPLSQWCYPTISSSVVPFFSCLQSFPASGSFPMRALCIRWPKYWSFSLSPSKEYSGLISCRMDWLDLLGVQGTLKSLLQRHSSKASTSLAIRKCKSRPQGDTTSYPLAWLVSERQESNKWC